MIDIDELERLAKAATPGRWRVGAYPAEIVGDTHVCVDTEFGVKVLLRGNENFYEEARANAAFSAAADRDTVLALIAEVRALREFREMGRKQVYELMGIAVDIEQFGSGFDEACMNTLKRVMEALSKKEPK